MGKRVEQVVLCQNKLPSDTLGVNIFERLEGALKSALCSGGDASFWQGKLRLRGLCGSFAGGEISVRETLRGHT